MHCGGHNFQFLCDPDQRNVICQSYIALLLLKTPRTQNVTTRYVLVKNVIYISSVLSAMVAQKVNSNQIVFIIRPTIPINDYFLSGFSITMLVLESRPVHCFGCITELTFQCVYRARHYIPQCNVFSS